MCKRVFEVPDIFWCAYIKISFSYILLKNTNEHQPKETEGGRMHPVALYNNKLRFIPTHDDNSSSGPNINFIYG